MGTVWIDVEVKVVREKAVLVSNGHRDAWVPLGQIVDTEDELAVGVDTRIEISERLAEEKELV